VRFWPDACLGGRFCGGELTWPGPSSNTAVRQSMEQNVIIDDDMAPRPRNLTATRPLHGRDSYS
jgi:hypothetical protein